MKKIILIILALVLLAFLLFLASIYYGFNAYNNNTVSREHISGQADSEFVAETVSNNNLIEFSFTPKTSGQKDYLFSYELKKDNETISYKNKELVKDVSQKNPISLEIERESKSEYSLATIIYDINKPELELHNDQIVIHPQEIKN
jgi:hypothetical protein